MVHIGEATSGDIRALGLTAYRAWVCAVSRDGAGASLRVASSRRDHVIFLRRPRFAPGHLNQLLGDFLRRLNPPPPRYPCDTNALSEQPWLLFPQRLELCHCFRRGRGGNHMEWGSVCGGQPGQGVEGQGPRASCTRKCSEAGCGRPEDGGGWAAKTVKRPPQQRAQPPIRQLLGAADAQTAHPATSSSAPAHQRLRKSGATLAGAPAAAATERSDPMQHAKGRTGDCPGPCKGTTIRRNVTQGGGGVTVCCYVLPRMVVAPPCWGSPPSTTHGLPILFCCIAQNIPPCDPYYKTHSDAPQTHGTACKLPAKSAEVAVWVE